MRAGIYCFLVLFVMLLNLDGAATRHLPVNNYYIQATSVRNQSLSLTRIQVDKQVKKVGSKPPSCEHKCYGCIPCEAIQVPTITKHLGVLYTNYEPEGWKCKCGPTFYSP